jgi:hypothetical protein
MDKTIRRTDNSLQSQPLTLVMGSYAEGFKFHVAEKLRIEQQIMLSSLFKVLNNYWYHLGDSIFGSVRFWTKINNQAEYFFFKFLNRT